MRVSLLFLSLALFACGPSATPRHDGSIPTDRDAGPVPGDAAPIDARPLDTDARFLPGDAGDADVASGGDCPPPPTCDAPLPDLGATAGWRHESTRLTVVMGPPRHRGRDLFLTESDPQWALAKFAYGVADDDLKDEDVDIYLLRECEGDWELLGTATTTMEGEHPTVESIEDTGGRVYFELPSEMRLGVGRHRLLYVVRGDHTTADQFIEVLPHDARFVVSDVDGTLTESEYAEVEALFLGSDPDHQPSSPELLEAYVARGYHVLYLTARPDWLHRRTHEWLAAHGYPDGIVQTTLSYPPKVGSSAAEFKTDALRALLDRFPGAVEYGIGNADTDVEAYGAVGIAPERAYFYQFDPGAEGTRVDDYATLIPTARALPSRCE